MTWQERQQDLAQRFGLYASFPAETDPEFEFYGEGPAVEVARLLDLHAREDTRFLDIGCGAGGTIAVLALRVAEARGIDMTPALLEGAQARAREQGLTTTRWMLGDTTHPQTAAYLPPGHFSLALSQRGPNVNAALATSLAPGAIVIQELVGTYHGHPLQAVFGRLSYAFRQGCERDAFLTCYADLGLHVVSIREFFYDAFYRDVSHLEADLVRSPWQLSNWRVGHACPYDPERDRAALALYARYHTTPRGIRVAHHRYVMVFQRRTVDYYPAEGWPGQG